MDELRLIKRIQQKGDRTAADELVRYYYDEIYGFARKQTANEDIALELTQEIFISALKTIRFYDKKKGAGFRTWLYRVATNKIVDWFRSQTYHKMVKTISLDEIEPIDEADFTRQFEDSHFAGQVCAFLGDMPADTQEIFRLHIFGGYTFSEIAGMEGIPESTVKSKYYRLINLIRKEFANYG